MIFSKKKHQVKKYLSELLPSANEGWQGYVFTGVCLFTGGVHGRGCAWQEECAWQEGRHA